MIRKVLFTGLATGTGAYSIELFVKQVMLAVVNFAKGWEKNPRWSSYLYNERLAEMTDTRKEDGSGR